MWNPTHVQVTVQRARNLRAKGRAATNDAFVLIQMGKEKFQTSVKEKCTDPEWYEECDLSLMRRDSEVALTVFHRSLFGMDEFLGQASVPLSTLESYDRPVNKWYPLKSKSGRTDDKYRGEIEVSVAFVVRSCDTQSLNDFSISGKNKQHRNSLKNIAASVGHKIQKIPGRTFSFRTENFDPRARLAKLRLKRHNQHSSHSESSCDSYDGFDEDGSINDSDFSLEKTSNLPAKPIRKFGSIYSSTLSLPQSAMITSSIKEDVSLEDNNVVKTDEKQKDDVPTDNKHITTTSVVVGNGTNMCPPPPTTDNMMSMTNDTPTLKKFAKKFSISESKSPSSGHGEWTSRISSRMKDLTKSEMNLSDVSRNDVVVPTSREKRSALESIKHSLRRHTLQLTEVPDLSSFKIGLSPKKSNSNASTIASESKNYCNGGSPCPLFENLPNVLKDIPPEVVNQYEKMNHQELVILAIRQQTEIESLRDKVSDIETYLDNLLLRVMETSPRLLQNPYKPKNLACSR